jgi:hypothetical protein
MTRDMPEFCDVWGCWTRVQTWCPLCEKVLCVPHDTARHGCLGDQADDEDWGPDSAAEQLERGPR